MSIQTTRARLKRSTILSLGLLAALPTSIAASANTAAVDNPLKEELEEIIVSTGFVNRTAGDMVLGVTVLNKDEIYRQLDGTIGQTLARQPGITSTFFGPGASRPVIRGLGGDRIRVLDNGIGTIDASSNSPDHAVAVEPALAERIEILRGTAMLRYGNSAAGGIVNVLDSRIARALPEGGYDGALRYAYTTVDEGNEIAGGLNLQLGGDETQGFVLHASGSYRDTNDYDIPGFAESELFRELEEMEEEEEHGDEEEGEEHGHEEEEEAFGTVENSATETWQATVGGSYVFENGFFGVAVKGLESLYGVPGGHGHGHEEEEHEGEEHDEEEEEEEVTIDLEQIRVDLMGQYRFSGGTVTAVDWAMSYADYEHTELEGDETGTIFANEGFEGRFDLSENWSDEWKGSTGVQYRIRDFSAIGEEAFVPPSELNQYGIYTVKEWQSGNVTVDFGGRFEHSSYEGDDIVARDFNSFSGSAGVGYDFENGFRLGANTYYTERAPSAEELYSNGPHLATDAFEIGDPDLDEEKAFGLEGALTYRSEGFTFRGNLFYTHYDGFIFENPTGEEEDGLDVFRFQQEDATFWGFEASAVAHMGEFEVGSQTIDWDFDAQVDYVRARLSDNATIDRDLPRIPPLRLLVGTDVRHEYFEFRTELQYVAKQDDVAEFELPTEDYLLWNVYLTVRPFTNKNYGFEVRGTNLGDVDARQHTSFLKDQLPLPGANVRLSFTANF